MKARRENLSPKEAKAAAFKAYWLKYGMNLFNRAEAHGVDWMKIKPEKLSGEVILAEEFAAPDEYKQNPYKEAPNIQNAFRR
jgi:hypothetical protein